MNDDTIDGTIKDLGGKAKETIGQATGDEGMQAEGLADQFCGKAQRLFGDFAGGAEPLVEKAKAFVKDNPGASLLAAAVVGAAVIGSLRGSGRED